MKNQLRDLAAYILHIIYLTTDKQDVSQRTHWQILRNIPLWGLVIFMNMIGMIYGDPATPPQATVTLDHQNISGLDFNFIKSRQKNELSGNVPLKIGLKNNPTQHWVVLEGTFEPDFPTTNLNYVYIYNSRAYSAKVKTDEQERFTFSVLLKELKTPITLETIDPYGRTSATKITITCPSCVETKPTPKTSPTPAVNSRLSFTPSIGLTHLSYAETNIKPYSDFLPTAKLGCTSFFSSQWNLGVNAFINLTTIVRFLGVNGRIAYSMQATGSTWKTLVMLGAYSLGMTVKDNAFGFDRLNGPQILIAERKTFNEKNATTAYLKYAPLFMGTNILLSNREWAGGLSYERKILQHYYTLALDASLFNFNIGLIQISSQTLNLSLGMSL